MPLMSNVMHPEPPIFQFRSELFVVDPKEDEQTNPFCYGQSLAEWVKQGFTQLGYTPEAVIPEDWGWCVMLKREPFMLWVGCGNLTSDLLNSVTPEQKDTFVPNGRDFTWSCLVGTDVPIWTSFFWQRLFRRASTAEHVHRVAKQLEQLLRSEPGIRMLDPTNAGA